MNSVVRICLVLFGIAYLISPIDIIPDLLIPYLGWLDDGVILWAVYYIIRHGKLPWSKKDSPFFNGSAPHESDAGQSTSTSKTSGPSKGNAEKKTSDGQKASTNESDKKKAPPTGKNTASSIHDACKVLEVSPRASWKEIQAAYREQSKKYHPDRVSHLGKEFSQLANEKFVEIQNSYELLKREKGR